MKLAGPGPCSRYRKLYLASFLLIYFIGVVSEGNCPNTCGADEE